MEVKVWAGTAKSQLGIRVGTGNRNRYFTPAWTHIEVEMDGTLHSFALTAGFWKKCPEFRDSGRPVIREWLRQHGLLAWPKGAPPALTLIPLERNRFRLLPK